MRAMVSSSIISSVEYDELRQTMDIEFKPNGAVYRYYEVPQTAYTTLVTAQSVGGTFHETIKDQYRCEKIYPPAGHPAFPQ